MLKYKGNPTENKATCELPWIVFASLVLDPINYHTFELNLKKRLSTERFPQMNIFLKNAVSEVLNKFI